MSRYAKDTKVSKEQSIAEIQRTLERFGADGFSYGWQGKLAFVNFMINDRVYHIVLKLPARDEDRFRFTSYGNERSEDAALGLWQKECKRMWRSLAFSIKAKLISAEDGISTIETEFMPFMLMPDGQPLKEHLLPKIDQIYKTGKVPLLLPAAGGE